MQNLIVKIGNFYYYPAKIIGKGATGLVYLGFKNLDKTPIAVKAIKLQQINTAFKKHLLDCEVIALKSVKSKYICQTYDVLTDAEYYYVPMQYCPNGTLRNYIKSKGRLSQTESLNILSKIIQGYEAIRQAGLIHRDLKTQNILLRANMQPTLIDFGYCQRTQTQGKNLNYNVGSPAYMSPQAYNDSFYSQKSDIWALGVILHQMVTGAIPFMKTFNVDQYFLYLKTLKTAEIIQTQQSQLCNYILRCALTVNLHHRITIKQLKNLISKFYGINNPQKNWRQNIQLNPIQKINNFNIINTQFKLHNGVDKKSKTNLNNYHIVNNIAPSFFNKKNNGVILNKSHTSLNYTNNQQKRHIKAKSSNVNITSSLTLPNTINYSYNNNLNNEFQKQKSQPKYRNQHSFNIIYTKNKNNYLNKTISEFSSKTSIQNGKQLFAININKNRSMITPNVTFSTKPKNGAAVFINDHKIIKNYQKNEFNKNATPQFF